MNHRRGACRHGHGCRRHAHLIETRPRVRRHRTCWRRSGRCGSRRRNRHRTRRRWRRWKRCNRWSRRGSGFHSRGGLRQHRGRHMRLWGQRRRGRSRGTRRSNRDRWRHRNGRRRGGQLRLEGKRIRDDGHRCRRWRRHNRRRRHGGQDRSRLRWRRRECLNRRRGFRRNLRELRDRKLRPAVRSENLVFRLVWLAQDALSRFLPRESVDVFGCRLLGWWRCRRCECRRRSGRCNRSRCGVERERIRWSTRRSRGRRNWWRRRLRRGRRRDNRSDGLGSRWRYHRPRRRRRRACGGCCCNCGSKDDLLAVGATNVPAEQFDADAHPATAEGARKRLGLRCHRLRGSWAGRIARGVGKVREICREGVSYPLPVLLPSPNSPRSATATPQAADRAIVLSPLLAALQAIVNRSHEL